MNEDHAREAEILRAAAEAVFDQRAADYKRNASTRNWKGLECAMFALQQATYNGDLAAARHAIIGATQSDPPEWQTIETQAGRANIAHGREARGAAK